MTPKNKTDTYININSLLTLSKKKLYWEILCIGHLSFSSILSR